MPWAATWQVRYFVGSGWPGSGARGCMLPAPPLQCVVLYDPLRQIQRHWHFKTATSGNSVAVQRLALYFHCWASGVQPGWGTKIPEATLCGHTQKKDCHFFSNLMYKTPFPSLKGQELLYSSPKIKALGRLRKWEMEQILTTWKSIIIGINRTEHMIRTQLVAGQSDQNWDQEIKNHY